MTALCHLLLLAQVGAWAVRPAAPTVGDTVRIARTWQLEPGAQLRVGEFPPENLLELLARPATEVTDHAVRVRYVIALFEPGSHRVALPDIEILSATGPSRFVPGDTISIILRPVLPASDTALSPQPSLAPMARRVRRIEPLLILTMSVGVIGVAWGALRLRRHTSEPLQQQPFEKPEVPLSAWARAGEARAAAAVTAERLRGFLAERVPGADSILDPERFAEYLGANSDLPVRDIVGLLTALERAKFAPAFASDVMVLVDEVDQLIADLSSSDGE